jgi:cell division protein YceG involved in septum cleavage
MTNKRLKSSIFIYEFKDKSVYAGAYRMYWDSVRINFVKRLKNGDHKFKFYNFFGMIKNGRFYLKDLQIDSEYNTSKNFHRW